MRDHQKVNRVGDKSFVIWVMQGGHPPPQCSQTELREAEASTDSPRACRSQTSQRDSIVALSVVPPAGAPHSDLAVCPLLQFFEVHFV